jgi:hypothetical protein
MENRLVDLTPIMTQGDEELVKLCAIMEEVEKAVGELG